MKKFCDPQLFHDPPPLSEENDSPLTSRKRASKRLTEAIKLKRFIDKKLRLKAVFLRFLLFLSSPIIQSLRFYKLLQIELV